MGNLVVEIDVKENVEEGPMMVNTELLEAWISSGKANSVSGRAIQVTRVSQTCSSYLGWTKVTQRLLWPNYESGEAGVRLGKTNSVLDKTNVVSQVASGLPELG
jgi:hypothetical protein